MKLKCDRCGSASDTRCMEVLWSTNRKERCSWIVYLCELCYADYWRTLTEMHKNMFAKEVSSMGCKKKGKKK